MLAPEELDRGTHHEERRTRTRTRTTELNGVTSTSAPVLPLPPAELSDIIDFPWMPRFLDQDFLRQKYVEERLSAEEVACLVPCSTSTVLKHLKKLGIPVRGPGQNVRRKRALRYGYRIEGRQEVVHQGEMANIEKMKELRARGFSYWKIAEIFNSIKIPTKTRKGKWHARSVQQILDAQSRDQTYR